MDREIERSGGYVCSDSLKCVYCTLLITFIVD